MKIIADLHVHSKYARATSPTFDLNGIAEGAKLKGIDVVATGDFTHPKYFEEIKATFGTGADIWNSGLASYAGVRFILSTEVSVIYELNGKTKKMHHVLLAPSLEIAAQINERTRKFGDIGVDGRPMLHVSSAGLVEELMQISRDIAIIPAHIWTPWFSVFGSSSGVDSIEEAFEDKADKIFALETGLSSDPLMNWMISALDKYTLVSNSDAHSKQKLGREANVFEFGNAGENDASGVTYGSLINAIKTRRGFVKTYEFYPEEGKYHYDGHRDCKVNITPWQAKEYKNICPVCRRKLTIGVMHRVADLADRKFGFKPERAVPFQHIVPLPTVIAKALKKSEAAKGVWEEYDKLIHYFGNEFAVYEAKDEQLRFATSMEISNAIIRVNKGEVKWIPGHDGVFGELVLDAEPKGKKAETVDKKQTNLAEFG
ncbi:TPA: DNA helicase UvrD [Candidatus Micrarchaeota archaeon]|nr:DNA helicase UvrD [Candidatus Micrarchaeota archaeon]